MDPATLRKASECCRLRAQAAGVGVSVLSQLRLCQALTKACNLDERNCCQNLLGSRKGLILFSFQSWGAGTQLGQPLLPSRVLQRGRCPLLSLEGEHAELPRVLWKPPLAKFLLLGQKFPFYLRSLWLGRCTGELRLGLCVTATLTLLPKS